MSYLQSKLQPLDALVDAHLQNDPASFQTPFRTDSYRHPQSASSSAQAVCNQSLPRCFTSQDSATSSISFFKDVTSRSRVRTSTCNSLTHGICGSSGSRLSEHDATLVFIFHSCKAFLHSLDLQLSFFAFPRDPSFVELPTYLSESFE